MFTCIFYLVRNFSWLAPAQYSCHMSLNRKIWNTNIRKPIENQNIAGSPPNLFPCLCSAITWCSWAGAEMLNIIFNWNLVVMKGVHHCYGPFITSNYLNSIKLQILHDNNADFITNYQWNIVDHILGYWFIPPLSWLYSWTWTQSWVNLDIAKLKIFFFEN